MELYQLQGMIFSFFLWNDWEMNVIPSDKFYELRKKDQKMLFRKLDKQWNEIYNNLFLKNDRYDTKLIKNASRWRKKTT